MIHLNESSLRLSKYCIAISGPQEADDILRVLKEGIDTLTEMDADRPHGDSGLRPVSFS